ncbi:MFS transporter [Pseudonocardia halophobica]|uniref:MFS transporter n=1 Tax=Pseudonocardia halophobica TaxID=29401 RepID=A0A9W6UFN9_9PSEU|nr:MFS transporter [Pseudonocardia halophobica]GLL15504.1 MFS transporter [Pseudonocardia halophobica]
MPASTRATTVPVRLGLRENLGQFTLLALVNLLVGGMVGLERTVTPLVGAQVFGLGDLTVALFVMAFGVTKAVTNLVGGAVVGRYTRKKVLVAGWIVGLPVPFLLAFAPNWWWVIGANVLLGVNQGLTWSMTVNMKIDLVGPARRGLALGINETAGYLGVAVTALATGYLATTYGLQPAPELLGAVYAIAGLALTVTLVRDTSAHARLEAEQHHAHRRTDEQDPGGRSRATAAPGLGTMFAELTWRDRNLASISQAGLVNNLNDGLTWVLLPVLLVQAGVSVGGVGAIKALYPFMWAVGMLGTGHLADRIGRKIPVVAGMAIQAVGLLIIVLGLSRAFLAGLVGSFLLGVGTALVYPALLAAISDGVHPAARAAALGGYRFWRDIGYAVGALVGGVTAALASLEAAVLVAAGLTAASAVWSRLAMRSDRHRS